MKTHRAIQKDLFGFLKDELSQKDRLAVEKHLRSCRVCAAEFQAMRETTELITDKMQKPSERRSELYWQQFAEKVERRIQAGPEEAESDSFISRLAALLSENRKPFSLGFASALSLTILAFAVWNFWIRTPVPDQIANETAPHGAPSIVQKTAMEVRAENYLEQSKILLIGIMNTDPKSLVGSKKLLDRQRDISRSLVRESQEISSGLTDPSQQRLRELVSDLGMILVQIANIESAHGVQGVEVVKGGVERNGILFKINLEEIHRATQSSRTTGVEKQAKSKI